MSRAAGAGVLSPDGYTFPAHRFPDTTLAGLAAFTSGPVSSFLSFFDGDSRGNSGPGGTGSVIA